MAGERHVGLLRRARGSVRLRVAALAAGLFAVTLIVAALLLLRALEHNLVGQARRTDEAALTAQAASVLTQGLPPGAKEIAGGTFLLPAGAGYPNTVMIVDNPRTMDQIGGSAGSAGSPPDGPQSTTASDGGAAISAGGSVSTNQALPPSPGDLLAGQAGDVLVTHVTYGGLSLSTATPLDRIRQTIGTTRHLLWILGPILVALVAGLAWLLVGRALRPVHAVTSQVAAIGSRSLNERVPVPAAGDEITELASTMNSMLERLESANDTSRRLVSDAAHELRTPVAVMRTELEVTRSAPVPDWQATGDVLLDELGRLSGLVDDLLLLARGDERAAARDHVVLADVVHDVAARRRRIPVEVHIADPDLDVVGDDEALRRAVDHLVANAARHGAATVQITVQADPGEQVAIHVDDDGPGIAVTDRDDVVRRFVRLDEGRSRDGGGAGLGLAVVSDVAAAHGGRLEIGDSPPPLSGARLTIHLPRRPPLASATGAASAR